jgi:hypothetical protein
VLEDALAEHEALMHEALMHEALIDERFSELAVKERAQLAGLLRNLGRSQP